MRWFTPPGALSIKQIPVLDRLGCGPEHLLSAGAHHTECDRQMMTESIAQMPKTTMRRVKLASQMPDIDNTILAAVAMQTPAVDAAHIATCVVGAGREKPRHS